MEKLRSTRQAGQFFASLLEADMPPNEVVSKNGMMVEYGAVDIGGKSYICPLRGVSVLLAHTTQPRVGDASRGNLQGAGKDVS
jgi:hypothetical protein